MIIPATLGNHTSGFDQCIPSKETARSLAEKMIGKRIQTVAKRETSRQDSLIGLQISNLTIHSNQPHGVDLTDISLEVRRGEILGIAGIAGNGQIELMGALSGEVGLPYLGSIHMLNLGMHYR